MAPRLVNKDLITVKDQKEDRARHTQIDSSCSPRTELKVKRRFTATHFPIIEWIINAFKRAPHCPMHDPKLDTIKAALRCVTNKLLLETCVMPLSLGFITADISWIFRVEILFRF